MNMVRAGAVKHLSERECCGYQEIQKPRQRDASIDRERLYSVLGPPTEKILMLHKKHVDKRVEECACCSGIVTDSPGTRP